MAPPRLAVAASGGRDSTALLHAAARAGSKLGIEVLALHVHHGLQPEADRWLVHLRAQCRRWAAAGLPVTLAWRRLEGRPAPGDSVEAWARRERYAALAGMAREGGADLVLLAHHRRDQAETFLLQALRGAGPAGLAAMPALALRDGITWARPWLDQPREAVEAYLRHHRLSHVEDASNANARFARSRLRQSVWPALSGAFPDSDGVLAAAAKRAQEADACLRELADVDLQACADDAGLHLARWRALSPARRANVLRAWLGRALAQGVPESLLQRLLLELPGQPGARWQADGCELRGHGGVLHVVQPATTPSQAAPLHLDLRRPGRYALADWAGAFVVETAQQGGVAAARLRDCELRLRSGGEQFQRAPGGVPRSLKKQFQALGVPAWQRDGPLLYAGDDLLFVPGLGIDGRQQAGSGPRRHLHWEPDAPT